MSYLSDSFLLNCDVAEELYFTYARNMPIFDYHCHLSEKEILADRPFEDIYELWLLYDHYKWRLMRNYGIDESLITGDASHHDKFVAYCTALGTAFGNPLYHWSQMELKDYFDCDTEINAANAEYLWQYCNDYIHSHNMRPSTLITASNVRYIFTTNEVYDDLSTFESINSKFSDFSVYPAYRADKMLNIDAPAYLDYIDALASVTFDIETLEDLEDALTERLTAFIEAGCTAADMALEYVPALTTRDQAEWIFNLRMTGNEVTIEQADAFKGYLARFLMELYAENKIVCELHIGAKRNNNSRMLSELGADSGFDSITDVNSTMALSKLFDSLNNKGALPSVILFNLNPKMNMEFLSLIGCFQDGSAKGKMQYGAAWWFLDHKPGMERHLTDLCSAAHIDAFLGMLTDSRSFLSYARHQYFRRILCSFLGGAIERGEMTSDLEIVGSVIRNICYNNAVKYFNME